MRRSLVLCTLALAACSKGEPRRQPPKDLVATVNGAPITRTEVELRLRAGGGHQGPAEATPEARQGALEAVITQELFAQRAQSLGLDGDPAFLDAMAQVEAQVREVRRRELSRLFVDKELSAKAEATPAEVQAYFEANAGRIRVEVRVSQLLVKGRAAADALAAELAAGRSFDDVARGRFPALPGGQEPWRLGFLTWQQVPEPWWPELDRLSPGGVSGPIAGPSERFWVIRLDEKRESAAMTLEVATPTIKNLLRAGKADDARAAAAKALRAAAKVEVVGTP